MQHLIQVNGSGSNLFYRLGEGVKPIATSSKKRIQWQDITDNDSSDSSDSSDLDEYFKKEITPDQFLPSKKSNSIKVKTKK